MAFKEKWRLIEESDFSIIEKFLSTTGEYSCEMMIANLILWRDRYRYEMLELGDQLIVRSYDNNHMIFYLPFGGDLASGINIIEESAKNASSVPMIVVTPGLRANEFNKKFSKKYQYTPYRDGFEYIYLSENLANLPGKKFHSKRNHIASFTKNHYFEFLKIDNNNFDIVLAVANKWFNEKGILQSMPQIAEYTRLPALFEHKSKFDIRGGLLIVDGIPAGYTIGSRLNDEVFVTHSEKVLSEFSGAYSLINREFAKSLTQDFKYINREDDLGIEGLRKAKLSYYPDILLEKYICTPI